MMKDIGRLSDDHPGRRIHQRSATEMERGHQSRGASGADAGYLRQLAGLCAPEVDEAPRLIEQRTGHIDRRPPGRTGAENERDELLGGEWFASVSQQSFSRAF